MIPDSVYIATIVALVLAWAAASNRANGRK